jgi:hypothetical protein
VLLICLTLLLPPCLADVPEELNLIGEHAVDGVPGGNLSALEWCGNSLWTVSDREDDRLYRLVAGPGRRPWSAVAEVFAAPPPPRNDLPWAMQAGAWALSTLRGGELDFEGLACDAAGNRYLLSESHVAVLQVPEQGPPQWLDLPPELIGQARAQGLLQRYNELVEGIAIDTVGKRLWLAAERNKRGLLLVSEREGRWGCGSGCVLLAESGREASPLGDIQQRDFSGLSLYQGKLFTLQRNAYQVCRRDADTGSVEHCWSFARDALTDARSYGKNWGMAEGLAIDADSAWIMVDNGGYARGDGESRPILWRFAAPPAGWLAP